MMRKTYKCSLLALSVLASFTSCSESESLQQANLSDDKITFQPSLDNSWKSLSPSSSSRAAKDAANEEGPIVVPTSYGKPLYLHSLEQDGIYIWSKDGKRITRSGALLADGEQEGAAQTRGAKKDNINDYGSFGVTAIYKEGNTNVSLFQKDGNPEIAVATPSNNFWIIQDSRWPMTGEVSFHAFAPYNAADNSLAFNQDIANGKTQITYTASNTDIASQPDLIVATNKGSKSKEALGLNFYHALTAVTFSVNKNLPAVVGSGKQLTKIELQGIYNKGICDLSLSGTANVPNAVWTLDKNNKVTYTFDVTDKNIIVGQQDYALTLGDQTLMMIPQTLETGAKVCFTLTKGGQSETLETNLTGEWKAGTTVNYNLSSSVFTNFQDDFVYDNSWNMTNEVNSDKDQYIKFYPKEKFVYGDEVGVYVVNQENELVVENLKLTSVSRTQANGYSAWDPENGKKLVYSKKCRYFCYYPYSNEKKNVNLQATEAHEFFADKINNLQIVEDQSTEEKIKSLDFQVGSTEITPYGIFNVKLKHQVGLVVLKLPKNYDNVIFTDNSYMYFYGDKNFKKPAQGVNFLPNKEGNPKTYFPSTQFNGNKAFYMGEQTPKDGNEMYKKYVFVVPFNQSATFKAAKDDANFHNQWGFSEAFSVTPTLDNPVAQVQVDCDEPGGKIARQYYGSNNDNVYEFDVPEVTKYELQCWGSVGQSVNNGKVALGGKSKGIWTSTTNDKKLYICCGDCYGYNNGKSKGFKINNGWGGGATHIATELIGSGETYSYVNKTDALLMVAGGSGSSGNATYYSGAGGGVEGSDGHTGKTGWAGNASRATAKKNNTNAANQRNTNPATNVNPQFGLGGYMTYNNGTPIQGGGGIMGGGGAASSASAAGGTGYVNTSKLTDASTMNGANGNDYPNNSFLKYTTKLGACWISWMYHRPATLK